MQQPYFLDGAVLERYDALCAFAKRLHMKMLPIAADEALEFGTQAAAEVRSSAVPSFHCCPYI
jgi:hypothetical protein